ncbi:methyl-accepting chemotaxis protein [Bosea vestrisii]|uniref:methyl-accepting chemotaxis protein n=1 Tax=Bosea vestrisii TaxID=151416 RepID=UPI0024DF54CB|nr:methyl-accepting chemotaxis protein [Bosea vestrisii]WID98085.1 methyl-accepting chemotaxis protein [Bosea vestrisii]
MNQSLETFRRAFAAPLMTGQWLLVPVTCGVGWLAGHPALLAIGLVSTLLAAATTLAWRSDGIGLSTRLISTIAINGQVALLVFACEGTRYQIDLHMAFFAALAVMTAWCCWRSIVAATAVVAVHHLVLNFAYPAAVFPDGSEFLRVVVHAVILLAEAGALIWIAHRLAAALDQADEAAATALLNQESAEALRHDSAEAETGRGEIEARLIEAVSVVVDAAKRGDFSVRTAQTAELGRFSALVRGIDELTGACESFLDETDRALAALADGDLTARMSAGFEGRLAAVAGNFNRSTEALAGALAAVVQNAGQTRTAAEDILSATLDLSQRGESQASAIQDTSSVIEEIAATVRQTSDIVQAAARKARATADDAGAGVAVAERAVEAIDKIDQQSRRIVDIVEVMDGLAFQTNLLALNASVEAARAGEGGRGFAVVATEVRRLAQQSADAARDVRALISETKVHVDEGVKLVREAGASLTTISGEVEEVAQAFGEISQATAEQSQGVGAIERALVEIDAATQDNAQAAARTAAAGRGMAEAAEAVAKLAGGFRLGGVQDRAGLRRAA